MTDMDHFLGRNDEQMQCRGILHIVEAGDTLYRIGKKYGVPVSRVMYANPYVDIYNLQPGDEICVPVMTPRMPMWENGMPDSMTPAIENPMGFPLAPLKDGGREEVNGTYMGNRMPFAEAGTGSEMQEAAGEDAAEGRSAQEQTDMGRTQQEASGGREEDQQLPSEPVYTKEDDRSKMRPAVQKRELQESRETVERNDMDRGYASAEECMGREQDCAGMRSMKAMPWDDTGVSEQMMSDYLQRKPR